MRANILKVSVAKLDRLLRKLTLAYLREQQGAYRIWNATFPLYTIAKEEPSELKSIGLSTKQINEFVEEWEKFSAKHNRSKKKVDSDHGNEKMYVLKRTKRRKKER
jgi:hypothetical protein